MSTGKINFLSLILLKMLFFCNVSNSQVCSVAPYNENFNIGIGTFLNNGWILDSGGTQSLNTGPSDDISGGGNYIYYEASGSPQDTVFLISECFNISSLTNPTLRFYYHMYGANIGTLNIYINNNLEWSLSGNQFNSWNLSQIDLINYSGIDIVVTFSAVYGGGWAGDIAIDNIEISEPLPGCTDSLACNYDAFAIVDDGSCLYPAIAPYFEGFGTGSLPLGNGCNWFKSELMGDGWQFNGLPEYAASYNGRDTGTYAWVDFSNSDSAVVLEMEPVNMVNLTTPALFFDYFSDLDTFLTIWQNPSLNKLFIETWDGLNWNLLGSFQLNISGWNTYYKYLTNTAYINDIVKIRFRAEESQSGGSNYLNDLLLDNVRIENIVFGCTDSLACNYDALANIEDSSCCYNTSFSTISITSCDSYSVNSSIFNNSGNYNINYINSCGCDSVISLELTIFYSDSVFVTDSSYTSYIWGSQNLTQSGLYVDLLTNINGCDSIVYLDLTIFYDSISNVGLNNILNNTKSVSERIDILGRKNNSFKKSLQFIINNKGRVKKYLIIE